jgi:hypothetical protein
MSKVRGKSQQVAGICTELLAKMGSWQAGLSVHEAEEGGLLARAERPQSVPEELHVRRFRSAVLVPRVFLRERQL